MLLLTISYRQSTHEQLNAGKVKCGLRLDFGASPLLRVRSLPGSQSAVRVRSLPRTSSSQGYRWHACGLPHVLLMTSEKRLGQW